MSMISPDLHEAVQTVWNDNNLDYSFNQAWPVAKRTRYPVLHDQLAAPAQPFPYCIFTQEKDSVVSRDSGHTVDEKHYTKEVPIAFRIHSRARKSDTRTAKEIGAFLIEEVTKVFGGHPEIKPDVITLTHGSFLITQLLANYGVRLDGDVHLWILEYNFIIDVPVAA